ncbi:MAG: ABC transporter substrate-binding protein [Desertimonas sp.]
MTTRRTTRALAALAAAGVIATGGTASASTDTTGPDDTTGPADTTAPAETTGDTGADAAGGVDLSGVCPATIVIQTDWFPEAEHGGLYEMIGDDYQVDTDRKVVSGSLIAHGGADTGVDLEVRTGGPAIGYQAVSVQQYQDDSITLGYANTEGQILRWEDTPTISVVAPLEINPQIIYWDPETYPDVETLADLGTEGVTINIFEGGTFADVFVGNGTWNADQIDGSYDGTPTRFIASDGAIAQQGFASAEPYTYEFVFEDWMKPVRYQTLHDAGFQVYSQTLSVRPDQLDELSPCLELFVPIVQQAQVDYAVDPARANAMIIDAVDRYADSWTYDEGLAEYSVATQLELGVIGNGPDETLGNMDEDRIQTVIDQIRDDAGLTIPDDLVATDLFTNDFIDESIGLAALDDGATMDTTVDTAPSETTDATGATDAPTETTEG